MFYHNRLRQVLPSGGMCIVLFSYSLQSVSAADVMTADEADQLRFEVRQLQLINENQAKMLRQMDARLQQLESPRQMSGAQPQEKSPQNVTATAEPRKKEAAPSTSVENLLQEEHALFTDKFTVEVGLNYSHYDRKELVLEGFLALDAIFLGDISVDDVQADIFTLDVTGRYNVTDRWQIGATLPFVYRNTNFQRNVSSDGVEADVSKSDLGDITLSSAYQLFKETADRPDIVWNLSVKAPTGSDPYGTPTLTKDAGSEQLIYPAELPTGSGLWSITTGLSFVKTTDPAILFANLGYTYHLAESFKDISSGADVQPGEVRLGESFHYGIGMAFALNERMSLSTSFSQRISLESEIKSQGGEWQEVIGSDGNAATFSTGLTYALGEKLSMSTSIGIGLTPDAPDFSLGIKFPYRF